MPRPEYLVRDPQAVDLESRGLSSSLEGDQTNARVHYGIALNILLHDPTRVPGCADLGAQAGSIERNIGFTYVRDGLATHDKADFQKAFEAIERAVDSTATQVAGAEGPKFQKNLPDYTGARRELFSAHGASLGLLARAATAAEVVLDDSTAQTQDLRDKYGWAHDYLRTGNNGYYYVSNAMNCARDERIAGHRARAAAWVARAAFGLLWTAKNDSGSLWDAGGTFIKRMSDLRSQQAARESVRVHP